MSGGVFSFAVTGEADEIINWTLKVEMVRMYATQYQLGGKCYPHRGRREPHDGGPQHLNSGMKDYLDGIGKPSPACCRCRHNTSFGATPIAFCYMDTMSGAPRHGGGKSSKEYAMAQDYEIKVKVTGVDQATNQVDNLTDSMNDAQTSGSQAFGTLDKVLGGLPSKLKAGIAGVRGMVVGMKTLRGAIMATGIGALVVAVGSLIQYFKRTERGAQQLRVITATLGAVMDKLMDSVIGVGEFIFEAFNNPRETIKGLAEDIQTFVISKVEQLMEGLGLLGTAIKQAFEGDFSARPSATLRPKGLTKVGDSRALRFNPVNRGGCTRWPNR